MWFSLRGHWLRPWVPEALQLQVNLRDDFKAQEQSEAVSQRTHAASWGSFFPRVSLFAMQQFCAFNGSFSSQVLATAGLQNAYGLGLRLSWNRFDGGSSIARQAELDALASLKLAMGYLLTKR